MSTVQELYGRWINELWAGRPIAAEIVTKDFVGHWPGRADGGIGGLGRGDLGRDVVRAAELGRRGPADQAHRGGVAGHWRGHCLAGRSWRLWKPAKRDDACEHGHTRHRPSRFPGPPNRDTPLTGRRVGNGRRGGRFPPGSCSSFRSSKSSPPRCRLAPADRAHRRFFGAFETRVRRAGCAESCGALRVRRHASALSRKLEADGGRNLLAIHPIAIGRTK
jgi:hypothetical protein